MTSRKFGSLRMINPTEISPGSSKQTEWSCDCGRQVTARTRSVISGLRKTCGRCNEITSTEMENRKFGRLKLKIPKDIKSGSAQKVLWICDCGNDTVASIAHVVSGHTSSCGDCRSNMRREFELIKNRVRNLKTPIEGSEITANFLKPLETITKVSIPFAAQCFMCGSTYYPRWDMIRNGKSLTCGCTTNRISSGHQEIMSFLTEIGIEFEKEFKIEAFSYDITVQSRKLLIEYNSLLWHSRPGSKERDLEKHSVAISNGWRLLSLFEDEWTEPKAREKTKNLLRSAVGKCTSTKVRASSVHVQIITSDLASEFLDKFHYIGSGRARLHYGAYLDEKLIAVASFSVPTRQSKHPWELTRMAGDSEFRVHGVWSKILKKFVNDESPSSIVSFSDNRLFDGGVYQTIGFKLDGAVRPDYWWTKGKKRFHKSGLRKKPGEIGTETELRMYQGYRKVWDLGKKRWVWSP